ncbi:daunorubicin C-13 ketoreductase, partial [Halobacteriales archaeon QH_6_64_20]
MANGRQPEEIAGVAGVDCAGQQALVTGSTSGIGRETALALGRLGANVLVHGRDRAAGATVVDELEAVGANAQFIQADFTDVDAVRDLAATVRSATDELDLLVNNAGGLFRRGRRTPLGIERTFHVNHLAPYLLTAKLLDYLAPDARIVVTSSAAHRGVELDLTRVRRARPYSPLWAYNHSKLANVLFTTELA